MKLNTIKGQLDTRVKPSDFEGHKNDAWELFPSKYDKTPEDGKKAESNGE